MINTMDSNDREIRIRDALGDDAALIADFNSRMAEETEGRALDPKVITPGVAALLDDRNKGRYWVAECGGKVVGQIMVTYEWSDWRNGKLWWIQSVYVHPEYRRSGVFTALYRHVESLALGETDVCGLRLYVDRSNSKAQRTYAKLGMKTSDYLIMESMLGARQGDNTC